MVKIDGCVSVYFSELQNYGFNSLHKKFQNPKLAMQMSYELLTLEILHRIIVCCYEVSGFT